MAYRVRVSTLIDELEDALEAIEYKENFIELTGSKDYKLQQNPTDLQKGFACIVNLLTGNYKIGYGALDNDDFFLDNSIDNDYRSKALKPEFAVIKGTVGGGLPMVAHIILNEEIFNKMTGTKKPEVTPQQQQVLETVNVLREEHRAAAFQGKKLGKYELLNPLIQTLAKKGYLNISNAGISLTRKGKNAL